MKTVNCRGEGHTGKWKLYADKMTSITKNETRVYTFQRTEKENILKYTEEKHKL